MPVSTAAKVADAIRVEQQARGVEIPFEVVSNPEFFKEGSAVADFQKPDCIVVMDVRSAELTNYAANSLLAMKIFFMNELANLAESLGTDIDRVRIAICSDPRIGFQFIWPGCGYGGSCFPKDLQALVRTAQQAGYVPELLQAVEGMNQCQKQRLHGLISQHFGGWPGREALCSMGPGLQSQHRQHEGSPRPRTPACALARCCHSGRLCPQGVRRSHSAIPTSSSIEALSCPK